MFKLSEISSKISERSMHSGVVETRELLDEYVRTCVGEIGRQRAVANLARFLNWSPRRVMAVLHGEVRRMWFDEVEAARRWHQDWCDQESSRLEAKAALMRARRNARQEGDDAGSVGCAGGPVREPQNAGLGSALGPSGSQDIEVARRVRSVPAAVEGAPDQSAAGVTRAGEGL